MAASNPTPDPEPSPPATGVAVPIARGAAVSDVLDSVTDSVQVWTRAGAWST